MLFFDTNILVYTVDGIDPRRQSIAKALVAQAMGANHFVISTQVLQEFYSVMLRRRLLDLEAALSVMRLWAEHDTVNTTPDLLQRAFRLQQRHRLSIWDSLIVQGAIESACTTLYSEDLHHGMRFGALEIVNPFATPNAVHEAAKPCAVKTRAVRPGR